MDFRSHLVDQLDFIRTSCDRYDTGVSREGVRIAAVLRVLFHQTKSSTSLLAHLGATNIALLSTCDSAKQRQQFFPAMTHIQIAHVDGRMTMEYVPNFSVSHERLMPFNQWWFHEVVYLSQSQRFKITRKEFALGAANTDGGAHIDKELEPKYEQVLGGLGWSLTNYPADAQPQDVACRNGHLAALRQIGYEVLHSPELLALVGD